MDITDITTIIGTIGFPIFMCLLQTYLMVEERKSHKEETGKLSVALENNTKALTAILEHVRKEDI